MIIDDLLKLLKPLQTRVANMVARAVVQRVDDGVKLQLLQLGVLEGETREGCERFQQYGFTSVPRPGAEAVVLFVGGRRDHALVVAVDDRRYRKKGLQPGEVALYNDAGAYVLLKADGSVEVKSPTKVIVDTPELELAQPATAFGIKGTAYVSAEATFLTALATYATAIKGVADPSNAATPALLAAITAFSTAGSNSLSTKVKVG